MKRIGLLSLALVLALGTLGVAGALWSDWLYIDGYVETGYIGAEWSIEAAFDNETADKDVSWVEAGIDGDTLYVGIYNAYPCVTYTVRWDIHNTGTIPIHFDYPWLYRDLPADAILTWVAWDVTGLSIDMYGYQLHPGETIYGEITIHLGNDAAQDYWYYFEVELEYGQYNEFP